MWKKFVQDYLSFTKKDRVAVLVLLTLIFVVGLLPYLWPAKKPVQGYPHQLRQIAQLAAQLNNPDSSRMPSTGNALDMTAASPGYYSKKDNHPKAYENFYFDPNTLDKAGWLRLGIREKTAGTIINYLSKGGQFKRPEDLSKIYGLFKDQYERLLPYVKIAGKANFKKESEEKPAFAFKDKPVFFPKKSPSFAVLEINSADTAAFIALPGIGSKLAARIVNFREKLGGFYTVQQLAETYGLPDSTFNKIKAQLQCNQASVKQVNLNTADANTLKQHPYIRWNLANAIVQYRTQHGNFTTVDQLQQLALVTPELFEKVRPYLVL